MKLYDSLGVEMTYQNFGSAWLGVIRGSTPELELAFNGLFNFGATNGVLTYQDHAQCVATFWSSRESMRHYFFNQFYIPRFEGERHPNHHRLVSRANAHADKCMAALCANHEPFRQVGHYVPDCFTCGKIGAERPDVDMKDAILAHAFKESSVAHSAIDSD